MSELLRRGDPRLLGFARIAMGALFLVRTTPLTRYLFIPLAQMRGPLFGWPEHGWPMAWGDLLASDRVRQVACVVRTVAAIAFMLGFRARVAGVVAGLLGLLALSQDPFGFIFTFYVLFVATIALALTDAASFVAFRPEPRVGVASSVACLALVVAAIYGWSGMAKLQREWLGGSALLMLAEDGMLTPYVARALRDHATVRSVVAWGLAVTELGLAAGILHRATRRPALGVAVAMHLMFEVAARPDVMGWVMATLLLALATRASDSEWGTLAAGGAKNESRGAAPRGRIARDLLAGDRQPDGAPRLRARARRGRVPRRGRAQASGRHPPRLRPVPPIRAECTLRGGSARARSVGG